MVRNKTVFIAVAVLSAFLFVGNASCCDVLLQDSVFVFKKSKGAAVALPKKNIENKFSKKKKKTKKSTTKKPVTQKVVKHKNDSLRYVEKRLSLGDRVIMKGDSGADVKKLAEIMVKNLYMDEKTVPYTQGGEVVYEGELLRAVKLFQKVSGLYDDGIVGDATIKKLRKIHRWRRSSQ